MRSTFLIVKVRYGIRKRFRFCHDEIPVFPGSDNIGSSEQVSKAIINLLLRNGATGFQCRFLLSQ